MTHVKSVLYDIQESGDLSKKMAAWYRFVRDEIRYDPFAIELESEALSASRTVEAQQGHCLHKSVLFVTGLRAMGVPARLVENRCSRTAWVRGLLERSALGQGDARVQQQPL